MSQSKPLIRTELRVDEVVSRLSREEQRLKQAGAFAEAAGIRDAVVVVLRMADEEPTQPTSMEPST